MIQSGPITLGEFDFTETTVGLTPAPVDKLGTTRIHTTVFYTSDPSTPVTSYNLDVIVTCHSANTDVAWADETTQAGTRPSASDPLTHTLPTFSPLIEHCPSLAYMIKDMTSGSPVAMAGSTVNLTTNPPVLTVGYTE